MPVVSAAFVEFDAWAGRHGYHRYGASERGAEEYRRVAYRRPMVLLMGSEREGLTPEQEAGCEVMVRLPMAGRVTSLNLAVAASVMLYAMRTP
jgi:TrmH family RNA methyltransferase